jgi:L-malate glycosyltransferase
MKICYLAPAPPIHTQRWVRYFAGRGHEVHLISPVPLRKGDIGSVKLHVLRGLPSQVKFISLPVNLWWHTLQVRKLLKQISPDVVQANYVTDNGLLAVLSKFHPIVIRAMGSDILIDVNRNRLIKRLIKYVLGKADLVTCHGEQMREKIAALGISREKIRVIGLGVEMDRFAPSPVGRQLIREKLGLSGSPVIISTRSLRPLYNVGSLIEAAPQILKKVPDTKFIILGNGPQAQYLMDLSKSLGVFGSLRFIGYVDHDELPGYLSAADIYVSTSLSDGGPVSTLEAMACELPVVVTDVGEHRNWVKEGINGFIISTRSPDELAAKVVYLLENRDLRIKLAKANRSAAEQIAGYSKEVDKLEKLFAEVAAGNNRRRPGVRN